MTETDGDRERQTERHRETDRQRKRETWTGTETDRDRNREKEEEEEGIFHFHLQFFERTTSGRSTEQLHVKSHEVLNGSMKFEKDCTLALENKSVRMYVYIPALPKTRYCAHGILLKKEETVQFSPFLCQCDRS